ncbi:MAG: nitrous oxide reductase family maturation protein NosD [Bacteroidetes bacterium]|nr:nitrous oxide reductase family maturation protein NosD [Bacteroidota bacterium]
MRLFFVILCVFFQQSYAQTLQVCKGCTLSSIAEAIQKAKPGDTLRIEPGVYKENSLIIDKKLTLIGRDYPVIDGEFKGEVITVQADSVTLDGLFIKNVGTSYTADFAAIRFRRSRFFIVQNVRLETLFFGIYLEKSSDGILRNNRIEGEAKAEYNSGNGIHAWESDRLQVYGNEITGTRDGIYFEFVDDSRVWDNRSWKNLRYGLHFMFSNHDSYTHNRFENNGAGVAVMFSKNIEIRENLFKENWGPAAYGLLLKEINDAEIHQNRFIGNTTGLHIEGCNRIQYTQNLFESNGWAVKMMGASFTNVFTRNNFIANTFDISFSGGRINDNTFNSNYWSEYTGYDLDRDGVGDVPFRPVKLFSYIVNKTPESIMLMRSFFVDLVNFSEKVSPVFTPDNLVDETPNMTKFKP